MATAQTPVPNPGQPKALGYLKLNKQPPNAENPAQVATCKIQVPTCKLLFFKNPETQEGRDLQKPGRDLSSSFAQNSTFHQPNPDFSPPKRSQGLVLLK